MEHRFSLTLPSCGSCVSHSHCRECIEAVGQTLKNKVPTENIRVTDGTKELYIDSPIDRDTLMDLLDDMGIFAEV